MKFDYMITQITFKKNINAKVKRDYITKILGYVNPNNSISF